MSSGGNLVLLRSRSYEGGTFSGNLVSAGPVAGLTGQSTSYGAPTTVQGGIIGQSVSQYQGQRINNAGYGGIVNAGYGGRIINGGNIINAGYNGGGVVNAGYNGGGVVNAGFGGGVVNAGVVNACNNGGIVNPCYNGGIVNAGYGGGVDNTCFGGIQELVTRMNQIDLKLNLINLRLDKMELDKEQEDAKKLLKTSTPTVGTHVSNIITPVEVMTQQLMVEFQTETKIVDLKSMANHRRIIKIDEEEISPPEPADMPSPWGMIWYKHHHSATPSARKALQFDIDRSPAQVPKLDLPGTPQVDPTQTQVQMTATMLHVQMTSRSNADPV